jgi:hypothetical protein
VADAVRHPQAARDWPRAGRQLAHHYVDLLFDGRLATVRELRAFPDDLAAADAGLAHILAAVHLLAGGREERRVSRVLGLPLSSVAVAPPALWVFTDGVKVPR